MFTKIKYRTHMIQTIFSHAKGIKRYFFLLGVCMLATMFLTFIQPRIYKVFLDEVIIAGNFPLIKYVIGGYLSVFGTTVILEYISKFAELRFTQTVLFRVKKSIFEGYFKLPLSDYEAMNVGDRKIRLDDDTQVISKYTSAQTLQYAISLCQIGICAVLLFRIDWRLALFSFLAVPLTFLLDDMVSKKEKALRQINRSNDQEMTTWLQAVMQGWREVRALQLGNYELRKFLHFVHVHARYNARWINCWTTRSIVIPKIKDEFLMQFGLYFLGGLLIANGRLSIGDLLVFILYYGMMSDAMNTVSTADAELQADMPMTDRFLEVLKGTYSDTVAMHSTPNSCPPMFRGIKVENLTFTYPDSDMAVLEHVNLHIRAGERVAIVGKSGVGKTTLLKLLTGMLLPTEGNVLFSGIATTDISLEQMYSQIGFVMQENILFHTSIRENMLYGNEHATDDAIKDACIKANIWDFIQALPCGLDTLIGEKGIKLSGGQRQRLVLARQFLRDVQVYILDEATSALDEQNESFIQDTLSRISKDKTIIVVAHRESSIRLCERVIRLT